VVLPVRHRVVGFPPRPESTIGTMTTSHSLVGVTPDNRIPEQMTSAYPGWRRPARPRAGVCVPDRAPTLIDGLINRVHIDWPEAAFVLGLPSEEQVFVPPHTDGPLCAADHSGYFRQCVLPLYAVDPTRSGGRCRMKPLAVDHHPPIMPFYEIDLRSGMLVMGAGSAPHRDRAWSSARYLSSQAGHECSVYLG
jgi:hypothetical protein